MSPTALDTVRNSGPAEQGGRPRLRESRIDRIAKRAYEIYEARGGEHGTAIDDWLQAEREIDAGSDDASDGGSNA